MLGAACVQVAFNLGNAIGGYDIGNANKFDFLVGRQYGNAAFSMGAMQGDFGVGASYDLGRDFRLYSQLYDFDDLKVRLGGEFRLHRTGRAGAGGRVQP